MVGVAPGLIMSSCGSLRLRIQVCEPSKSNERGRAQELTLSTRALVKLSSWWTHREYMASKFLRTVAFCMMGVAVRD